MNTELGFKKNTGSEVFTFCTIFPISNFADGSGDDVSRTFSRRGVRLPVQQGNFNSVRFVA